MSGGAFTHSPELADEITRFNEQLRQMRHNLSSHVVVGYEADSIEQLRAVATDLGEMILRRCPETRERSLALTNLEQTVMWAGVAIARHAG